MELRPAFLSLALAASCVGPQQDSGVRPESSSQANAVRADEGALPAVGPMTPAPSLPPGMHKLWEASADLDGDGRDDRILLVSKDVDMDLERDHDTDPRLNVRFRCRDRCRGQLMVGGTSAEVELHSGSSSGIGIRIVDTDTTDRKKELVLVRRGGDDEDPPYLFTAVTFDGVQLKTHKLFNSWGYNSGTLAVDGKGHLTVRYDECPDASWVVYELRGNELVAGSVQKRRIRTPDSCAACPHVFVREASGWVHKGEILRNMRGPRAAGAQGLTLRSPMTLGRTLEVEIRELEDETTMLAEVWLELDGKRIEPVHRTSRCAGQGEVGVLETGDACGLRFELPADRRGPATLWARGYYLLR